MAVPAKPRKAAVMFRTRQNVPSAEYLLFINKWLVVKLIGIKELARFVFCQWMVLQHQFF